MLEDYSLLFCLDIHSYKKRMSWRDVFPVLTDEQIAHYEAAVTAKEADLLEDWCGVARKINTQAGKHLVVTTLFWKKLISGEGELPPITRERMMNARELGLMSQYEPWEHYVVPLLEGAASLRAARPDVIFRVYLAADLEFHVPNYLALSGFVCLS